MTERPAGVRGPSTAAASAGSADVCSHASSWSDPLTMLADAARDLGPGEQALCEVLSAGYPHAVLQRHDVLLERSGATRRELHRLLTAAGFRDLAELQARVADKLDGELRSPAARFEARLNPAARAGLLPRMTVLESDNVATTLSELDDSGALAAAADALLAARRRWVTGAQRSHAFAYLLASDLSAVLGQVAVVGGPAAHEVEALIDAGPQDVLVAFALRRYHVGTLRLAEAFSASGATVVAVTDDPAGPLAAHADVCLTAATASASYADSPTAVAAVAHALATLTAARSKASARRLSRREQAVRLLSPYSED
ncbi:SIS domain-containing protein [Actinacidiphila sp. DG2A-62]|uniref:MurR/RpiR family transcriptional regulator n=1 Tax=Actinacidiphila sp. DG2A-62 TaxID=3108821 RepID=UPI002DB9E601|nr:SIS domain-containing protein [Actinacidiphila sp. DG2A-62]MEC3998249.1 SIS domain-containing protein [Actinacidiphila sp. DG2A-62]